jgi:hypothetical protein
MPDPFPRTCPALTAAVLYGYGQIILRNQNFMFEKYAQQNDDDAEEVSSDVTKKETLISLSSSV